MATNKEEAKARPMGWVKNLLNNATLLRWVRKYSADNLMSDLKVAEQFGIKCNEESIAVGDQTMTKLIVTQARFGGNEFVRYNVQQLKETLDVLGKEGELIISKDNNNELFVQVKDTCVVISPLPKSDKAESEE